MKSYRTALTHGQKVTLGVIAGTAAAALVVYTVWRNSQTSAPSTQATATPGSNVQTVTLSSGQMSSISLDASTSDAVSFEAPSGGTLGTMTVDNTSILEPPSTGTLYELVAVASGSATVTVTYTDSTGTLQTSTIPVTVTDNSSSSTSNQNS